MMTKTDIVLINPGNRKQVYQNLGSELAAIEPPFWIAVIAAYLKNKGFKVQIIDSNAENISPEATAKRVELINPLLTSIIVYGSNPQASTQNMTITYAICDSIKKTASSKVIIGGLHPSALPKRTLGECTTDFVIEGEGPYTIESLLSILKSEQTNYSKVPGLWYKEGNIVKSNPRAPLIENLDDGIPIAAWDLLPMNIYKAHNWHCFSDLSRRKPYAAIYTSLGCPFSCMFCCINTPFGKPGIRYRSPELVVKEIEILVNQYNVKNIKIVDELFVLKEDHYMSIVNGLIKKGYDLNMWAYARVDTIKPENLKKMKKAGINWLGLGIESASTVVRDGANKKMKSKDIVSVVNMIHNEGIEIGGNFIFGLPEDTLETMQESLDLAMEINVSYANFYCATAYPGSKLYDLAVEKGWELPKTWDAYSQYSYNFLPLPSNYLKPAEILKFRDYAFHKYYENPRYLNMINNKFGKTALEHVIEMTKVRLKRKLLGD